MGVRTLRVLEAVGKTMAIITLVAVSVWVVAVFFDFASSGGDGVQIVLFAIILMCIVGLVVITMAEALSRVRTRFVLRRIAAHNVEARRLMMRPFDFIDEE